MLEIRDLTKRYGDVVALDGANFSVAPGRIVGFLGPNGAGKTTTMRAIFGLVRPDRGEVRWRGKPRRPPGARSVRLHAGGTGPLSEDEGRRAAHLLRRAVRDERDGRRRRLPPDGSGAWAWATGRTRGWRSSPTGTSSGCNWPRRWCTTRSSPCWTSRSAGWIRSGSSRSAEMLQQTAATGVAVVFSSHQLDLVEDVCQDVVIIDHGRIVMAGVVEELKAASPHRSLEITVDGDPWVPVLPSGTVTSKQRRQAARAGRRLCRRGGDPRERPPGRARSRAFSFEPPSLTDLFLEAISEGAGRHERQCDDACGW